MKSIIAHFTIKERAIFAASIGLFCIGALGGLVTLSNRFTTLVPLHGGTYREGIVGTPRFINPVLAATDADRDLDMLVYSGLGRISADGTIVPDLAESWDISADGKTYTVILKDRVRFHDGKKVTALDVVFTVESIQNPLLHSPSRVAWEGVTATAPDEHTVVFTLAKPYAGFTSQLTLGILPKHIWESVTPENWATDRHNTEPIGSGPYRVTDVSRSRIGVPESLTLKSFKRFALGNPYIASIVIECYQNYADALEAFHNDDINGLAAVDPADVTSLGRQSAITTAALPRVFGIFFNSSKNKIFADPQIAKALNLGVDKTSLIDTVFAGYADALAGPLPQSIDTGSSDYPNRKLLAEKMLDSAGWKLNPSTGIREKTVGKEKQILSFDLATANTPELEQAAELIADQFAEIGVHVEVKVFEIGTLNEDIIRKRNFQALLFGEVIRHDTDVYAFWHSSQKSDPGLNIAGYANAQADVYLESALKETNREKRFEIYTKLSQELAKDAPAVFLFTPKFIYTTDRDVQHIALPPLGGTHERFALIYQWNLRSDRVWNFFRPHTDTL